MRTFSKPEIEALTDGEVLRLSRSHPDVFEVLVHRYEASFLRKAQTILFSKEDAEEVVQDTFTRIYVYADTYQEQEGAKFSSWAYFILTRLAFTRYQKLKKGRAQTIALDPEVYEHLPDKENFVETFTISNEVLVALSKLPETAARLLRLQYLQGKTQEEIAYTEKSTVAAIKTRIHRAKKLFKEAFSNDTP